MYTDEHGRPPAHQPHRTSAVEVMESRYHKKTRNLRVLLGLHFDGDRGKNYRIIRFHFSNPSNNFGQLLNDRKRKIEKMNTSSSPTISSKAGGFCCIGKNPAFPVF